MKTVNNQTPKQRSLARRKCLTHFRQLVAKINKELNTPQINQCNGTWRDINFDKNVTSITLRKQGKAFQGINKKGTNRPQLVNEDRKNHSGSQIGGTGLAISKHSNFLDIALEYTFYVASEECQKNIFYDSGGQPSHMESWTDVRMNKDCNNFFLNTLETLEKSWLRPRYDGYMYFQNVAGTFVNRYLQGENSAVNTIVDMEREFEKSFYVN